MIAQRFGPRALLRLTVTLAFVVGVLAVGAMAGASRIHRPHRFDHRYPPDPRSLERPKVTNPVPRAAHDRTIHGHVRFTSLASLAFVLPRGTLVRSGPGAWTLTAPVDLTRGALLSLHRGTLVLGPGAFLQARAGGSIELAGMTITTTAPRPTATRGFVVARDGGRMSLRHDVVRGLGHLGALAYGVSFRSPAPGSGVVGCTIDGDYFGVFLSHAAGMAITGNVVTHSVVYGIDPYGGSHDDLVAGNTVTRSGLHGIVLARGVQRIRVVGNRIADVGAHGIVLFAGADDNVVRRNTIARAFDGIVVTGSSRNRIEGNAVAATTRFGIRVSGPSTGNTLIGNSVSSALLGIYVYGGATRTSVLDTTFGVNRENVRVRKDAVGTVVQPKPPLSELP